MNNKFILLLLLVPVILLNGCYATKTINPQHKATDKKKTVLIYQDKQIYEISEPKFSNNLLQGNFSKIVTPPIPKLMKTSMLNVYINPDYRIEIDTTLANQVTIPYESILRIEKTRIRVEYLAIVPILYLLFVSGFSVGSSF